MCRYAQFTLSSRQLNYRGFPLIFLNLFFICIGSSLCFFIITQTPSPVVLYDKMFLISGKRSKSFLPEIPFRYFTIAVMDNFGGADTKQCTWSPSPHSNRWTVKPLSSAISCTSFCRYASTSALNIFRRYFTDHTIW